MKAEILSWSRSQGVFAGISLEGATLRQDQDENAKIYGKPLTSEEILTGTVKRPATARPFLAQLQRFSGKGVPPVVVAAKHQQRSNANDSQTGTGTTDSVGSSTAAAPAADNAANNQGDRTAPSGTADQPGNNKSDVELTAGIRRSVVADDSLSTYAHNVKIVVQNGVATLKGPVRTEDEKTTIAAKAAAEVGADRVVNQMEVVPE